MKKQIKILYVLPLILTIFSCSSKNDNVIKIGTTTIIEKATRDEYNYDLLASGVSELPLVSKDSKGNYEGLVCDFNTNDSKTWTYTVKDNLKWSDGNKVTAYDVLYSLEYDYSTNQTLLFSTSNTKGIYSSYSIDENNNSLTLVLEEANVKELDNMTTFRIRPSHIYKDNNNLTDEQKRITCGPYVLSSFDKLANSLTFIKNEYYPYKVNKEKIIYKLYSSEDVLYSSLINEDIDLVWNYNIGVSSVYQDLLSSKNNINLVGVVASNCPAMLTFNNKKGMFSDVNLRNAVSYALNYDQFKTYFGSKYSITPNRSFAPSGLVGFKETTKLVTDYTLADSYMQKAGYSKVNNYYQKDGNIASFTLTINANKTSHINYGEFVKTQLEAFGIKVNLETLDSTHYNEKTSHKFASSGEHGYKEITMEAAIMGYTAYGMKDFGGMYINGNNATQGGAEVYSSTLDTIMNNLSNSKTLDEYKNNAYLLQDFYAENIPAIALYWDNIFYVYNNKLNDVIIDSNFGLNNIHNWIK